jgi:hypothetical protein
MTAHPPLGYYPHNPRTDIQNRRNEMNNDNTVRNAGLITITGTLIGVGTSITRAANVSYPSAGSVSFGEILTVIAFVSLFFGAAGLARSDAWGSSSTAKIGFGAVLIGLSVAILYEISLIIQAEPSEMPGILSGLLVGVGMLLVGGVVLQTGRWQGWRKFTPILIGAYPLFMVFSYPLLTTVPAIADMGVQSLDQALTAIWFIFWLPLGLALWSQTEQEISAETGAAG